MFRRTGAKCGGNGRRTRRFGVFDLFEDTFDGSAHAVVDVAKVQAEAVELRHAIDKIHGVCDVVILLEIAEKAFDQCLRSGRIEPQLQELLVFGSTAATNQNC